MKKPTQPKLRPCRFCGGVAGVVAAPLFNKAAFGFAGVCQRIQCGVGPVRYTIDDALKAWNHRKANQ